MENPNYSEKKCTDSYIKKFGDASLGHNDPLDRMNCDSLFLWLEKGQMNFYGFVYSLWVLDFVAMEEITQG